MIGLKDLIKDGVIKPLTDVVNTGLSIVGDKTRDAGKAFVKSKKSKGFLGLGEVSISSKRVVNLTISSVGSFILYKMFLDKGEITTNMLILAGIIVVSNGITGFLNTLEKKQDDSEK